MSQGNEFRTSSPRDWLVNVDLWKSISVGSRSVSVFVVFFFFFSSERIASITIVDNSWEMQDPRRETDDSP